MSVAGDPRLLAAAEAHPYPLVFATVSGAHLYGFPSPDSDFDLRGLHVLPWQELVGLDRGPETIERKATDAGLDLDLVTHDAAKYFRLMLRPNGYVLEQIFSPLVVHSSPAFDELRALGEACITREHARHYLGFATTQWKLFAGGQPPKVKPLLYVYRVLLTGIALMRTGRVQADLRVLNEQARLPHVDELISRKISGSEQGSLPEAVVAFHEREYARLRGELEEAAAMTGLPPVPSARAGLHDLLLRLRGAAR